ncbi:hypothetical protein HY605_00535 [Candidatus Peregrinibacteria bacterium]|nr:hypothetical protein [Candidatus Peregrinibacteria bacterium]
MVLKAAYEFLFVGKDENSYLESYVYDLFQEHGDKSGQVFINLEVQNNPVDAEEIGNVIYETMQKVFFEDVGRDPYERFEIALKSVNNILAEFKGQKVSGYIGNLNIVIAAIVGDQLFLTQTGDAEAYLIRKRYVSIVSEGLSDDSEDSDVFASIASGQIEAGDFVLFSSTRLIRYISKTDLASCVNKKSVVESLDEVKDIISTEILGKVALTGILFNVGDRDDVEAIEEEVDNATRSILESGASGTSASRESVVGKFLSKVKGYRSERTQVYKGAGAFTSMISRLWRGLFSKGFGKDKVLALLVIVIAVLLLGVWYANSQNAENAELERLDGILKNVQERIAEAETKMAYDKETAREILDKAYLDAQSVLDSDYREKAGLYLLQIEEARDKLDEVERVTDPKVLVDLSQKRSDINALGFALVADRVFVYEYNALYEIVVDQVQDPLTIDAEEQVIAATGFDDRKSVVFLTKSGKLIEFKDGTMSFMDSDDGAFHKGTQLTDWSNRIYLLDPASNQVWRYTFQGSRGKFSAAEAYIADDTDVSGASDLAIDANVYVLNKNGDIYKFYAGNKQEFYINNAPSSMFKDPVVIYTDETLNEVYVLDGTASRVLVFLKDNKTGNLNYKSQYLFDNVSELRDLYVDATTKKMYVLTESKVLELAL